MKKLLFLLAIPFHLAAQDFSKQEIGRWQQQSKNVTIIRDNWGIPHIYGKTDADAVFGMLYAQCEDDFHRVEMNYIEKLGRLAEVNGEKSLYADLLIRMLIDSTDALDDYKKSPPWLHKLMDAYADGINYYLYTHPKASPFLLHRFKPWYTLLWTDGSIGAISTGGVSENELKNFYSGSNESVTINNEQETDEELTGSNGFAFSPKITASHHSILYINPHVTFYFRPEIHVVSGEGLNVYGAVTWGQFFVYQGFNEHCGWMHTSSAVDVSDMYAEKVTKKGDGWVYEYEKSEKPVIEKKIELSYKTDNGVQHKTITTYYTQHGPVMAKRNGQWISVASHNRDMAGLIQSWQRTKAKSFTEYLKSEELLGNTSNNTVYADAEGNIAYWHGNYIPVRDPKFDWSKPVDGSIAATDWKGVHKVSESIHVYNPPNGWLQNCNSTPFTVAGKNSPKKENYPKYMAPDGENFRAINAVRVLSSDSGYTIDKVIAAGYNKHLAAFDDLVPALVKAYDKWGTKMGMPYSQLADPIAILKVWDLRTDEISVATTIAIEWGQKITPLINKNSADDPDADPVVKTKKWVETVSSEDLVKSFLSAITDMTKKYGAWKIPWGDINRFQRISADIDSKFRDDLPSVPVGFASSQWGMIPSYASRSFPNTLKRYGVNGNSFICAVEFGKRIKAKSLLAGGESGDPNSKHFNDQGLMYTKGEFKDVLFYKEDVMKHAERTYHPGD